MLTHLSYNQFYMSKLSTEIKKTKMFKKIFSGILISFGFVCFLNSQVPQLINYQGLLTNDAGEVITGARSVQFLIYNDATAGSLLWSETQNVDVEDGLFNTLLGSVVPIPYELFEESERYLAMKVEADNEMLPRQRLTSVAYAFQSKNTHLVNFQYLPENDGLVNQAEDPVSWYKLKDIPSDFADGTDDVGSGGSGITQINGGTGISVTNPSGPTTTLDLDMGHGNGINADMVDGSHASDFAPSSHGHLGDVWIESSQTTEPVLQISGDVPWSNPVLSVTNQNNGPAVWGTNMSTGTGLVGQSLNGVGVAGQGYSSFGVQGMSETSYGVRGSSISGFGGFFSSNNDHYDVELGGSIGRINTDHSDENSELILSSNADVSVRLDNDGGEDHSFIIVNSSGSGVFAVDESGNMAATGTKNAKVNSVPFGERLVYCLESPEVWFEDFGKATLDEAEVEVVFEDIFASLVNLEFEYHVFLTPQAQEPVLLFITQKTSSGFKVKGAGLDGTSVKCDFDYRIVAKRLGYENERLPKPKEL
jgi:hypothetical protein